MKKTLLSVALTSALAATTLVSTSAVAVEGLSANAAVTSNYLWRGQEQTNGAAAVSGGIDYAHTSGFYAGTWASNATWNNQKTELDLYFGFGGDITESISYDVGYVYFAYPDSLDEDPVSLEAIENDFSEVYASVSTAGFTLGLALLASSEDGADFGDSTYVSLDYAYELTSGAELALHAGNYSGDWLASDSTEFGASISKDGFTFGVSKLSADKSEEFSADAEDAKFYVSYAVDFEL